jgi:phospholipase/carboxylesterase/glyoxalase family protein
MLPTRDLDFVHVFLPADPPHSNPVTLFLLHGTGGDERDLLSVGRRLYPGAALLGVRGQVLENGMPRFFRRFSEGVLDVDDLQSRTEVLAHFIDAATEQYGFSKQRLVLVGYSNGANIASSLMFLHPHYEAAGILFRPMVPFEPTFSRNFRGLAVFISAGRIDPIVSPESPEQLARIFESGGADVSLFWHDGGHELGDDDLMAAKKWLFEKAAKRLAA